jgi:hypothetical protein
VPFSLADNYMRWEVLWYIVFIRYRRGYPV